MLCYVLSSFLEPRQSPGFVDITVKNRKRKIFPTQGPLNMKIRGSEVKANEKRQGSFGDNFGGHLNLININKGADAEPIGMLAAISGLVLELTFSHHRHDSRVALCW